ncbi:transcription factor E2F [Cryptosporidium andersoni]|uniref:Transcription factor E2F n=1 Tax=Cryptosporidium andersoni TaxID=117008 RepID=A0A1J4MBZ8_9CRYT|nr:transcription factor E2F [Cryptosporidium andersoni]
MNTENKSTMGSSRSRSPYLNEKYRSYGWDDDRRRPSRDNERRDSGYELDNEKGRDYGRDKSRDYEYERDRYREGKKYRDIARSRNRDSNYGFNERTREDNNWEREYNKSKGRDKERDKGRDKERDRERDRERGRDREHDRYSLGYRRGREYRSRNCRSYSDSSDISDIPGTSRNHRSRRHSYRRRKVSVSSSRSSSRSSYSSIEEKHDRYRRGRRYYSSDESSPERNYRNRSSRYSRRYKDESSSDYEEDYLRHQSKRHKLNCDKKDKGAYLEDEYSSNKKWQPSYSVSQSKSRDKQMSPPATRVRDSSPHNNTNSPPRDSITCATLCERLLELRNLEESKRCDKGTAKVLDDLLAENPDDFLAEDMSGRELTKQQFITWYVINQQHGPSIVESSSTTHNGQDKRHRLITINKRLFTEITPKESYCLDFEMFKDRETSDEIESQIVLYGCKNGKLTRVYVIKDKDELTSKKNLSLSKIKEYKIFAIFLRYLQKKGIKYPSREHQEHNGKSNPDFDGIFHYYDFENNPLVLE